MINIDNTVIYIGQLLSGMGKLLSSWETAGDISNIIMAAATISALVVASLAYNTSKASQWREFANSYFKEYRTPEMGKAVERLYRFSDNKNITQLVSAYIDEYRKKTDFHFETRRVVSAFYQEIAVISLRIKAVQKIAYTYWTRGDLDIIPKILLPIETIAMRFMLNKRKPSKAQIEDYINKYTKNGEILYSEEWAPAHKAMYIFWKQSCEVYRFKGKN